MFVCPNSNARTVYQLSYEKLGHLGVDKCVDDLKSKVESFIRNCLPCILHSVPKRVHDRTLHSIPKVPIPFDTIHIDHLGLLPCINSKRKHLLVTIDAFTKFVKLYAVNSTSTKEVNASLSKYFEYYSRRDELFRIVVPVLHHFNFLVS